MTISSIFQRNDATQDQNAQPTPSPVNQNFQVDVGSGLDTVTDRPITALLLPPGNYSGFRILITVNVDASTDVSEAFDFLGTSNGSTWGMSQNSAQSQSGAANISFIIDSTGVIKYTTTSTPGFVKRTLQWVLQTL